MPEIEIHGFAQSSYVRTARMVCIEKGVPHELVPLDFQSEAHRALHPFLRMPVLRAGDLVLYETLAIASYLDESRDGPALQPGDALGRARMLQWISASMDYVHGTLLRPFLTVETLSAEQRAAARGNLEVVDRALADGPYLLGAQFTLADLFLAPMVGFAESRPEFAELSEGLDGLAAWRETIWTRDSFRRTLAE
ncbi:MAG: glutathione S-transferase family protein [Inquilinus sp.]|nr:glutathione S-transferase family protein [Inquilinus sp.]